MSKIAKLKDTFSKKRWIVLYIQLWVPSNKINEIEEYLEPYSKELGWKIDYLDKGDKKIADNEFKTISLKKSDIPEFSPKEFLEVRDKVSQISFEIFSDLQFGGNDEEAKRDLSEFSQIRKSSVDGIFVMEHQTGIMKIEYPLYRRLRLEKSDPETSKKIFGMRAKESVKEICDHNNMESLREELKESLSLDI